MFSNWEFPRFAGFKKSQKKDQLADNQKNSNDPSQSRKNANTRMTASMAIVESSLEQAENYLASGNTEQAIAAYKTVLQYRPNSVTANHGMAIIADQNKNFAEAENYYQIALKAEPNNADVLANLGFSYYLQNRVAKSEQLLLKALQSNPSHRNAAMNLGSVYAARGDYNHALAMFRRGGTESEAQSRMARLFPNGKPNNTQQLANNTPPPLTPQVPQEDKKSWKDIFQRNKSVENTDPNAITDYTKEIREKMRVEREKAMAKRKQKQKARQLDPQNPFALTGSSRPIDRNDGSVQDGDINSAFNNIDRKSRTHLNGYGQNGYSQSRQNHPRQNQTGNQQEYPRQNAVPNTIQYANGQGNDSNQQNQLTSGYQNQRPRETQSPQQQMQRLPQIFKGSQPAQQTPSNQNLPNQNSSNQFDNRNSNNQRGTPFFTQQPNTQQPNTQQPQNNVSPRGLQNNFSGNNTVRNNTANQYSGTPSSTPNPSMISQPVPPTSPTEAKQDAYNLARQKAAALGLQAGPGQMFPVYSQNSNPNYIAPVSAPGSSSQWNGAMSQQPLRTGPAASGFAAPQPYSAQKHQANNHELRRTPDNHQGQSMPQTGFETNNNFRTNMPKPQQPQQSQYGQPQSGVFQPASFQRQNNSSQNSGMPQITPGVSGATGNNSPRHNGKGMQGYQSMMQKHSNDLNQLRQGLVKSRQLPPGIGVNTQTKQRHNAVPNHLSRQRKISVPEQYRSSASGQSNNKAPENGIVIPRRNVPSQGQLGNTQRY